MEYLSIFVKGIFVENMIFPTWRWMHKRVETVNETGSALRDVQHI